MTGEAKISLVVVTYNSEDDIVSLVSSSISHLANVDEIVVVDNDSTDGTKLLLQQLSEAHRSLKVFLNSSNQGYGTAINVGVSIAKNEVIAVSNADIVFFQDGLDISASRLMSDESIGLIFPNNTFFGNGSTLVSPQRHFKICDFAVPFIASKCRKAEDRLGTTRNDEVDIPPGNFFLIRKSVFMRIGGFDTRVHLYDEEEVMGIKLRIEGLKIVFDSRFAILHKEMGSVRALGLQTTLLYVTNTLSNRPYLYYKYVDDSASHRFMWWNLYLFFSIVYTVHLWKPRLLKQALVTFLNFNYDPYKMRARISWNMKDAFAVARSFFQHKH